MTHLSQMNILRLTFLSAFAVIMLNPGRAHAEADDGPAGSMATVKSSARSRFHLLSKKCEVELEKGPDATPQSPPLNVDDPATPGCNVWEVNVVFDADFSRAGRTWELPLLDINYGIGDNIQLKYEVPNVRSETSSEQTGAIGESKFGIKYMFFEDEEFDTQIAAYPQTTFVQANSEAVQKGLATPGTVITLPLLISMNVGDAWRGKVRLTGNLGYNISNKADSTDFVSASIGVGTPIRRFLSVLTELSTQQAVRLNSDSVREQLLRAQIGLLGTINQQFQLFGSVGRSLIASDGFDHTYFLAGFRVIEGAPSLPNSSVHSEPKVSSNDR